MSHNIAQLCVIVLPVLVKIIMIIYLKQNMNYYNLLQQQKRLCMYINPLMHIHNTDVHVNHVKAIQPKELGIMQPIDLCSIHNF